LIPVIILITLILAGVVIVLVLTDTEESQAPEETAAADTTGDAACGQSCNSDNDCIATTSQGIDVVCSGGKCRNSLCTSDNAQGTICMCTSKASCGQRCGYGSSKGTCVSGSSCTYITGPSCAATLNNTYCVPLDNADVLRPKCVSRDTGNSYLKLASDPTETTFTAADIADLCNPPTTSLCGNGTLDSGEACDVSLAVNSCGTGKTCSSSCTCVTSSGVVVLPRTSIVDRKFARIVLPVFLVLSGLFVVRLGKKAVKQN
jgi:FlaG/FlaF family flagellin (archaellin)